MRGIEDRLSEGLLLAFVLSLSFSITVSQLLLVLILTRWLWKLRDPELLRSTRLPLILPFLAFSAVTVISAALSENPWFSLRHSKSLLLILVFYAAVNLLSRRSEIERLLLTFAAAMVAVSIYGLIQAGVCTAGGPVSPWTAWLLRAKPAACGATFPYRAAGFYSIYMTLGGVLLMALTMTAALSFSSEGRRRLLLSLAGVAQLAALIATFSRNAWLGVAAGFITLSFLARKIRLVAVLAVAALILLITPAYMSARLTSLWDPRHDSARERLFMWRSGLEMVKDHPLLGVGPGGVKRLYPRYVLPEAGKRSTGHLHSNLVQIAAERGILGLLAWLWIWVAFFLKAATILRRLQAGAGADRMLTAGSLAAILGFLVAGLFEYNFGDSEVVMLAYLIMTAPFIAEKAGREDA